MTKLPRVLVALTTALLMFVSVATPAQGRAPRKATASQPIRINFQPKGVPTPCGWKADLGLIFGERNGMEYGWNVDHTDVVRDRHIKDNQLLDTLSHFHQDAVWEIAVPNGLHEVHVGIGDAGYPSTYFLNVEGVPFWWNQWLDANDFRYARHVINVQDGRLTIDQGDAWDKATRINFIEIDAPVDGPRPCKDDGGRDDDPKPGDTIGGSGDVGPRPNGLRGLKQVFGRRCNRRANDARTYYPSAAGRGKGGYVYYHSKLAKKVGGRIVKAMKYRNRTAAADYGVWGYACRMKTGGTSWSVHSWGAAVDTNTLRNPWGARRWDGKGSNGRRYGRFLPRLWMNQGFYWGINFRDPMHFQYVSGY